MAQCTETGGFGQKHRSESSQHPLPAILYFFSLAHRFVLELTFGTLKHSLSPPEETKKRPDFSIIEMLISIKTMVQV